RSAAGRAGSLCACAADGLDRARGVDPRYPLVRVFPNLSRAEAGAETAGRHPGFATRTPYDAYDCFDVVTVLLPGATIYPAGGAARLPWGCCRRGLSSQVLARQLLAWDVPSLRNLGSSDSSC